VTGCSQEGEAQVLERISRCLIRVHRADLHLSDADIQRALDGELSWADWHREVMIHTTRLTQRIKAGQEHPPDPAGIDRYAAGVVELLLRSALDLPETGEPPTAEDRRRRAERFIEQNLLDPNLSPEMVAANQAISLRQLSRSFADGPGVAATIVRARLDYADRLLRDPSQTAIGISDIAYRCGFVSPAHFSRAYKTRHGITPSDARHTAIIAPKAPQP
jgi:AraC-like DNA-binding protein